MTIAETLRKLPLFEGFEAADIAALEARALARHFPAHAPIVRQGDLDASMFVLTDGKARVTFHAPVGAIEIAILGKGDVVGEISLLTGFSRTASVTAISPVTAIEIDKPSFTAVVGGRTALLEHLALIVEQRRAELAHVKQEAEEADVASHASILERLTRLFG
jgi:CRP-like cAMP-binding protein